MNQSRHSKLFYWAVALGASVFIVVFGNVATNLLIGKSPFVAEYLTATELILTHGLQTLVTGSPFWYLAATKEVRSRFWVIAMGVSAATWAYYAWKVWEASLIDFAGGADIGLGMIMLFAPLATWALLAFLRRSALGGGRR